MQTPVSPSASHIRSSFFVLRSSFLALESAIIAMIFLASFLPNQVRAQRYIPAAGHWTSQGTPFLPGTVTPVAGPAGKVDVEGTGSLVEGTAAESGFFLHRAAQEGDDFRVCLNLRSATGVSGLMVRDHGGADAAFVFAGRDADGEAVVFYRQSSGGEIATMSFDPPRTAPWFRLLVGRDTVYVFDAVSTGQGSPGVWQAIAAVKVELSGGVPWQAIGDDVGGLFVSASDDDAIGAIPATFTDLHQTRDLHWSERTGTTTGALAMAEEPWSPAVPTSGQFAESGSLLVREGNRNATHLDFPLTIHATGHYRFYVHSVSGNDSPMQVALHPEYQTRLKRSNHIERGLICLTDPVLKIS